MKAGITWLWLPILTLGLLVAAESQARLEILSAEQKERLLKAERVLIDVVALTEQGTVDAAPLSEVVQRRMKELGYIPVTDVGQPYDVIFKVKCEEQKTWEGTMSSGGDADLPDSPSRVWKGPACQFYYLIGGKNRGWRKEVRTHFADAAKAAAEAKDDNPGTFAMAKLKDRLEDYDFPVKVTAEWGQEERLLTLLKDPQTPNKRKAAIIQALGQIFSSDAVPHILPALKDSDLDVAREAAIALGNIGSKQGIRALMDALKSDKPEVQALAAQGLGKLGALHGDYSIVEPLLEALNTQDLTVKTEVVWALGKIPDRKAYKPLLALQQSLHDVNTSDRSSKEGKLWDAVNYSIKQIDRGDQIN